MRHELSNIRKHHLDPLARARLRGGMAVGIMCSSIYEIIKMAQDSSPDHFFIRSLPVVGAIAGAIGTVYAYKEIVRAERMSRLK